MFQRAVYTIKIKFKHHIERGLMYIFNEFHVLKISMRKRYSYYCESKLNNKEAAYEPLLICVQNNINCESHILSCENHFFWY